MPDLGLQFLLSPICLKTNNFHSNSQKPGFWQWIWTWQYNLPIYKEDDLLSELMASRIKNVTGKAPMMIRDVKTFLFIRIIIPDVLWKAKFRSWLAWSVTVIKITMHFLLKAL